jgi:hypothetical protein
VEADPSVVNLGAFETFFPERRPFFLEGANLFRFGIGDDNSGEDLFYSRRIGRAPQRSFPGADHVDMPDAARIVGAGKLTGRVGPWSIGIFDAVTQAEHASVFRDGAGIERVVAEPLTNFAVGRVNRDFRDGGSTLGMMFTAVHRDTEEPAFRSLRSAAYASGMTARHRFGADRRYEVGGWLAGSSIHGDTLAIQLAQRAPQRYFQRPDAGHVDYDPRRTSLQGVAGQFGFGKISGGRWAGGVGASFRTPGFEVNDAGFQMEGDQRFVYGWFNLNRFQPQGVFRSWQVGFNPNAGWNWDGTRLWTQINTWGNASFTNFWSVNWFANHRFSATSVGALRGGPAIYSPGSNNANLTVSSDRRRQVFYSVGASASREHGTGTLRRGVNAALTARPSPALELMVQPALNVNRLAWQYVDAPRRGTGTEREYIFAGLDQTTLSVTTRASYTFTRDLTLQLYAQPFISAGDYEDFRRVADPGAADFNTRFETFTPDRISRDGRIYTAQVVGQPVRFRDPDFNVLQLRTNSVLRWEYRPGSTLFLVWAHGRNDRRVHGDFDLRRDSGDLLELQPTNVLLLKLNYWLNL